MGNVINSNLGSANYLEVNKPYLEFVAEKKVIAWVWNDSHNELVLILPKTADKKKLQIMSYPPFYSQYIFNFLLDGVLKQSSTNNYYDFSSETLTSGSHTISCYITYTGLPIGNKGTITYNVPSANAKATIEGLGSENMSSVVINTESGFRNSFEIVEKMNSITGVNDIFVKIPKLYRKIVQITTSPSQITKMILSFSQIDSTYKPYPCFIKEDGTTEMDYILIGQYAMSSITNANSVNATAVNLQLSTARTNARALGNGYQVYDWQIHKLVQDLSLAYFGKLPANNIESGTVYRLCIKSPPTDEYIDGINTSDNKYIFSYKPSAYVDNPTSATTDYIDSNLTTPTIETGGSSVKVLGYNANHSFFNLPTEAERTTTYDKYYGNSIGDQNANGCCTANIGGYRAQPFYDLRDYRYNYMDGVFRISKVPSGNYNNARLCYRPTNE